MAPTLLLFPSSGSILVILAFAFNILSLVWSWNEIDGLVTMPSGPALCNNQLG
ncbi:hypothetical protein M419DRAFT_120165 [Trichoderma reesei RUT C-30]|jgi:hypothetical protein|uniref:Uncharacterized protein n=1 Tax=Hypocrea jecorina (strain ATCC 56765 / BCRC 32924 / NRRL 11460 / Rut C-30) TaxID=1344414 RepID=A0A024S458_HYPJR|nr:hypothetical protein M419DRAFT_120165 [Trichoderma reesei RUT C-30]